MSEALFYDPAVIRVVRAILVSKGIRAEQDLEDAISDVVLAAIKHVRKTGQPPETVAEAIAIIRPIANDYGVDEIRKRTTRGKSNVGTTPDADEHAPRPRPSLDRADEERMLKTIRGVLSEKQIADLADVGAGVRHAELAAESNISEAAMRKRVQASREKARSALRAKGYWGAGGFAALLAGLVAVYVGRSWDSDVVTGRRSPRELAVQERREAAYACKEQNWDACEQALDRAAELDAQGEREAEVRELREAIAVGRRGAAGDGGGDAR